MVPDVCDGPLVRYSVQQTNDASGAGASLSELYREGRKRALYIEQQNVNESVRLLKLGPQLLSHQKPTVIPTDQYCSASS